MKHLAIIPSAAMMSGLLLALFVSSTNAAQPTTLIGHQKSVVDVEFSADGKYVASIAANGETILWDLTASTGRRGPKVNRDLSLGATCLQFTRETPSMLIAGCDMYGFVIDPVTNTAITEWADPKQMKQHYPLLYVGGRRFVNRTAVVQAGSNQPLFAVGDRNPPLAALSPDGTKWFTNRNMPVGNNTQVQVLDAATGRVQCDLKAFTSPVRSIAWAGHDRVLTLIDGGQYGGSLMLWDASGSGKLLSKVDVPGGWRLAASGNGKAAAAAMRDGKMALVEIGDKQLRVSATVNAGLWSDHDPTFAMSHNGERLLAASPSDARWQLVVLDVKSGKELLVHKRKHDDALPELAPDGGHVAVGHADGSISLLPVGAKPSPQSGGPLTILLDRPLDQPTVPGIADGIRNIFRGYNDGQIAMSRDGEVIVVGGWRPDSIASIVSTKEGGKHLPVWEKTSSQPWKKDLPVWTVLADGTVLVEGTIVGNEKIPNFVSGRIIPKTGEFQLQRQSRKLQFTGMQPSPDGRLMAVRAGEWKFENYQRKPLPPSLMLLDMQSGKLLRTLATDLDSDTPCLMRFSSSGARLAVLERWKLRVFETTSGDELPLTGEWKSTRFWFLDEGQILARQESDGSIVGVNLDTQAESFRWNPSTGQSGQVTAVEFSLDGKLAAVGGRTGDLTLRNPRTGEVLHRVKPMELPIGGLGFSADGEILAAADEQRRLMTWKIGSLDQKSDANVVGKRREIRVRDF